MRSSLKKVEHGLKDFIYLKCSRHLVTLRLGRVNINKFIKFVS